MLAGAARYLRIDPVLDASADLDRLPLSVLLVEDRRDVAESLSMYLSIVGDYRIRISIDGEEAIRLALADPPDVVVCDLGLPKRDGFEVARELSALSPPPLLIAVTGYGEAEIRERAWAAGYQHFLIKPADPHQVDGLLRAHQSRFTETGPRDFT